VRVFDKRDRIQRRRNAKAQGLEAMNWEIRNSEIFSLPAVLLSKFISVAVPPGCVFALTPH
jgi:hypothetical protein